MSKTRDEKKKIFFVSIRRFIGFLFLTFVGLLLLFLFFFGLRGVLSQSLPASFSNQEQGKIVEVNGAEFRIVYIGGQRFRFPKTEDFIWKGGFFESDEENDYILIRLYWPDIPPGKAPEICHTKKTMHSYFKSRIWVQVRGSEVPIEIDKRTIWERHPYLDPTDLVAHDDFALGLRVFNSKKYPNLHPSLAYSLNNEVLTPVERRPLEIAGGIDFNYTPRISVYMGLPPTDNNKIHPNWKEVYQGVIKTLDKYREDKIDANH